MDNEIKKLRNQFKDAFHNANKLRSESGMEAISMADFTDQVSKAVRLAVPSVGSNILPDQWVAYANQIVIELAYDLHGAEWGMAEAERNEI